MKIKHLVGAAVLLAASAQGAMTLQFASTSAALTNLQSSTGSANSTLVWGIIVDTQGDGFRGGLYLPTGLTVTDNVAGQLLTSEGDANGNDDRLYISTNLMTTSGTADGSTGLARPTNLLNLAYANGVAAGQKFAIVWFDYTTKTGQEVAQGHRYGILENDAFVLPADSGSSFSYAPNFVGADPARPANLQFVPEPSAVLLGLLGAVGLIRRRR